MSWVRLDDAFADHPKIVSLDDTAFRLHVSALCYAARQLTDGQIAFAVPYACIPSVSKRTVRRAVCALVDAGLWVWAEGGFAIHDYLDHNPDSAQVKESRRLKKERQERWLAGKKKGEDARRDASRKVRRDAPPTPTPKGVGVEAPPLAGASPSEENNLNGLKQAPNQFGTPMERTMPEVEANAEGEDSDDIPFLWDDHYGVEPSQSQRFHHAP